MTSGADPSESQLIVQSEPDTPQSESGEFGVIGWFEVNKLNTASWVEGGWIEGSNKHRTFTQETTGD